MTVTAKRYRIGDVLLEEGLITEDQLQDALRAQKSSGQLLGELLVDQGIVSPQALVRSLSRRLAIPGCTLRAGLFEPRLIDVIGQDEARRLKVLPMFKVHGTLTVAMAEPQSLPTVDWLNQITGCRINPVLALESNILDVINHGRASETQTTDLTDSLDLTGIELDRDEGADSSVIVNLDQAADGNAVVKLVNVALLTAVRDRASDVHVEPSISGTRIRYRVDGVLRDLLKTPKGMHSSIVSRVKIIGQMDIAEKRLPQEGRVRAVALGKEIDMRVSSMPTLLGEKMVLRLLDKTNLNTRMEELGFRPEALNVFQRILRQPNGLVLVTGPTGSGKTTTLYSALDMLRSPDVNIITVEDPVEYQLDLINQVPVQESIGMSFARALRSILRQDPDIIMVGEIRDEETARVAIQAALTGHLVLATLHTNDAPGAVSRLLDMGIEPYLLSGALNGVVAQRLARTVCGGCATQYIPDGQVLEDAGLQHDPQQKFRKGTGCQQCHGSGFQGRVGIYEVMEVTGPVRRLVHRAAASHDLRESVREQGGRTLREEGCLIAQAGKSSLEEILRVTRDDTEGQPDATNEM